jgi:hypothetical protein
MSQIDRNRYPLFNRMAGALFQGLGRHFSSEDQLPAFLLEFFRETELEGLLAELQQISSMNLNDEEWEEYWYSSPAYSFPKDAGSSTRLIKMVVAEIHTRREGQ